TTLHEALTGHVWIRPEPPSPRSGKRRSRTRTPPPRPAGLTDRVERAIRKATEEDPTKRPLTCADFMKLLRGRSLAAGTPKPDTRSPSSATDERREYARYSLGMGASAVIYSSVFDGEPPSTEVWPLVVQDVSRSGIGILLARRCEPGTDLLVEVTGPDQGSWSLPVQVVRVRRDQCGHWMHGCAFFSLLEEEELNALLNHMGKTETV